MTQWSNSARAYSNLITDPKFDSSYLREVGLQRNIVDLIGDCSEASLLDVGTGNGWLFDHVTPARSYACDIYPPSENLPSHVEFSIQDIKDLNYIDDSFDVVVASLVLMWCDEIQTPISELFRVTKKDGGTLIVSLMHPYFYRTGDVDEDSSFRINRDLSEPFEIQDHMIANRVGPFTYYYRRMDGYMNALIDAGWIIRKVVDWFVDMDAYERALGDNVTTLVKRTGRVPMYTIVKCAK